MSSADDNLSTVDKAPIGMYAFVAGLTAAIPLPVIDELLSSAARGAAMRRVAQRHGVKLSHDARKILSQPTLRATGGGKRARWVRSLVGRVLAPLRIASRLEDGATAMVSASLFDHYLRTSDRPEGQRVDGAEAQRIHRAIEKATMGSAWDVGKAVPMTIKTAVSDAVQAFRDDDEEDRGAVERVVDATLDAVADAPDVWRQGMLGRFEKAMMKT